MLKREGEGRHRVLNGGICRNHKAHGSKRERGADRIEAGIIRVKIRKIYMHKTGERRVHCKINEIIAFLADLCKLAQNSNDLLNGKNAY